MLDPKTATISSGFGSWPQWRKDAGLGWHTGADFPATRGTPIVHDSPLTVLYTGSGFKVSDLGYYAVLQGRDEAGREYALLHGHQDKAPSLYVGQELAAGAVNGHIGNTGWSTGPHSHCMLTVTKHGNGFPDTTRWGGGLVDPQAFLNGDYYRPAILDALFDREVTPGVNMVQLRRFTTIGELSLIGHALESVSVWQGGVRLTMIPGAPNFVNSGFPRVLSERAIVMVKVREQATEVAA